jgi:hypothetical protein
LFIISGARVETANAKASFSSCSSSPFNVVVKRLLLTLQLSSYTKENPFISMSLSRESHNKQQNSVCASTGKYSLTIWTQNSASQQGRVRWGREEVKVIPSWKLNTLTLTQHGCCHHSKQGTTA